MDIWDVQNTTYIPDFLNTVEIWDIRDFDDFRELRSIQELRDVINICDKYVNNYKTIIKDSNKKIEDWADMVVEKFHSLSDKKLLHYFPGTDQEELLQFRESEDSYSGDAH